jgi:aspartate/methionine/tyrosine aminotransferase
MTPADGAFYLYIDISEFAASSVDLCRRVLDETGVALTPGVDFDPARGHHYVRLSFAGPEADTAAAADRLTAWFGAASRHRADSRSLLVPAGT